MKTIIKNDYTNAIFPIANKAWLKYASIQVLLSLVPLILLGAGFISLVGEGFIEEFRAIQEYQDIAAQEQHLETLLQEYLATPIAITYLILTVIVFILLNTWMIFGFLQLNKHIIAEEKGTIPGVLSAISMSDFSKILGCQVLIGLGSVLYFIVTGLLTDLFFLFLVLGFLAYFFFLLKFTLALPAIVYNKSGVGEALRYSWHNMTTKTTFGFYLGIIVLFVAFFIISLVIRAISMLLGNMTAQLIISQLCQIGLSAYMYALLFAAISSYYYSLQPLSSTEPREEIKQHD